jgi:hypothetical protein
MNNERPELTNLVNTKTTDVEKFQNEVLRPIIKMQNDLLFAFLKNHSQKRKIDFKDLSDEKIMEKIKIIFEKDNSFKNQVLGLIIGHFSEGEFLFYASEKTEFHKRIKQIILQRLQSNITYFTTI